MTSFLTQVEQKKRVQESAKVRKEKETQVVHFVFVAHKKI